MSRQAGDGVGDQARRGAESPYGVWAPAMGELVSYRHLGCSSVMADPDHAIGRMVLRPDLRIPRALGGPESGGPGGLQSAPLAIAMLDTAGICIDRVYHLGLTHIEVQIVDPAHDVKVVHVLGRVVRWARTQVFTEATFVDTDDHDRVLGIGTADWAVISPTPPGFEYTDPARAGGGTSGSDGAFPPLALAYDAIPISGGYEIAGLSTRVGTDTLHHGPILVALEATAIDLAGAAGAGSAGAVTVESASVRIVKAGRSGPFRTSGTVLTGGPGRGQARSDTARSDAGRSNSAHTDTVLVRTELIAHGQDDAVIAVAHHRLRQGGG